MGETPFTPSWPKETCQPVQPTPKSAVLDAVRRKDGAMPRNFKLSELTCADGTPVPEELEDHANDLLEDLQVIRDFFNARVTINSGYRTRAYNTKIGGAKNSKHLTAQAADIVVEGFTATQVADAIEGLCRIRALPGCGLGRYKRFVHYDTGPRRRWNG